MSARWTRALTVGSVLLVALVAAVVSYAHMWEVAERSGEAWRAWLFPLSVDGMLLAATLAIVDRRRARQPAGWVPWTGLMLGLAASLAANVAAARPDVVAQLVAAWPPVALAVSIETLVIVLRNTADVGTGPALPTGETGGAVGDEPGPVLDEPGDPGEPPDWWADAPPAEPDPAPDDDPPEAPVRPAPTGVGEQAGEPGDDRAGEQAAPPGEHAGGPGDDDRPLLTALVGWAERAGRVPTRDRVKDRFGVGSARANRLREHAAAHLAAHPPGAVGGDRAAGGDGPDGTDEPRAG